MQFRQALIATSLSLVVVCLLAGCASEEPKTGQALLVDLAKNSKHSDARLAAARELNEQHQAEAQATFADIAKTDGHSQVYEAAIRHLTDQALLADVAKNARICHARFAAAEKLDEQHQADAQTAFAEIAIHTCRFGSSQYEVDMKVKAVGKMTDQKLLAKVAKRASSSQVRQAAVEQLGIMVARQARTSPEK